ncbi:hypothetical protein ACYZTX_29845 [Pseudomonas sp. MDT1-17]
MKVRITLVASALALLSLTGCASQAQIDEQNKQLATMTLVLTQIQANQLKSMEFQKAQLTYQQQQLNHDLQQK